MSVEIISALVIIFCVNMFFIFTLAVTQSKKLSKLQVDYFEVLGEVIDLQEKNLKYYMKIEELEKSVLTSYNNMEIITNNHANNLDVLYDKVDDLEDCIKDGEAGVFFESDFDVPDNGNTSGGLN